MKGSRTILALGILALSSTAFADSFRFEQPGSSPCAFGGLLSQLGIQGKCGTATVSVPEPATLGLLGIGLIGLAVKRRRK